MRSLDIAEEQRLKELRLAQKKISRCFRLLDWMECIGKNGLRRHVVTQRLLEAEAEEQTLLRSTNQVDRIRHAAHCSICGEIRGVFFRRAGTLEPLCKDCGPKVPEDRRVEVSLA